EAMSLAGIAAVTCVPLTNVVVRLEPLTWTTAPFAKFEPLAVNVKPGPPAVALLGEMLARDGGGFVTLNVTAAEGPPPGSGLKPEIERPRAEAMSDAGIGAVSWVLMTNVVVRPEPLTCTTAVETKLLPVAVSVKPGPPAVALLGEMLASDGAGFVTMKVT